jgi:hypothetical protein
MMVGIYVMVAVAVVTMVGIALRYTRDGRHSRNGLGVPQRDWRHAPRGAAHLVIPDVVENAAYEVPTFRREPADLPPVLPPRNLPPTDDQYEKPRRVVIEDDQEPPIYDVASDEYVTTE